MYNAFLGACPVGPRKVRLCLLTLYHPYRSGPECTKLCWNALRLPYITAALSVLP